MRWLSLLVLWLASVAGAEERWLDSEPFSLSPRELLESSSPKRPDGVGLEVMLADYDYAVDAEHRRTRTLHRIARVLDTAGREDAANLVEIYSPWYEDAPEVRARVISPSGEVVWLDPATLVTLKRSEARGNEMSAVQATFPAVAPGSVVESWVRIAGRASYLGPEAYVWSRWHDVESYTRVRRIRLRAPRALPLTYRVRGGTLVPVETGDGDVHSIAFVERDLRPLDPATFTYDPGAPPQPDFALSTAESWAERASAYAQVVERALQGFDAERVAQRALSAKDPAAGSADPLLRTIQRLLEFTHARVRYEDFSFGDRSLVPAPPGEVLARGFGDCKEKSVLLVALLRSQGFDAHVALLRAFEKADVIPEVPGIGGFNHLIVHVRQGDRELWIDPSWAYLPAGVISYGIQERSALIVAPQTSALVRIPRVDAQTSVASEEITLRYASDGSVRVTHDVRAEGALGAEYREAWDEAPESLQKQFRDDDDGQDSGLTVRPEFLRTLERPVELHLEYASESRKIKLKESKADATFDRRVTFLGNLPKDLVQLKLSRSRSAAPADPRYQKAETPLYVFRPHRSTQTLRAIAPSDFIWGELASDYEAERHGVRVARTLVRESDQVVSVRYAFEIRARALSAEELASVIQMIQEFESLSYTLNLEWLHVSERAFLAGRASDGVAALRRSMAAAPRDVDSHLRYVEALTNYGVGDEALRVAQDTARQFPRSLAAQLAVADAALRDVLGRRRYSRAGMRSAEAAYRRAMQLEPRNADALRGLAELLLRDENGKLFGPVDRLEQALELTERLPSDTQAPGGIIDGLVFHGKLPQARRLFEEHRKGFYDTDETLIAAVARGVPAALEIALRDSGSRGSYEMLDLSTRLERVGRQDLAQIVENLPELESYLRGSADLQVRELRRVQLARFAQRQTCADGVQPAGLWVLEQVSALRTGRESADAMLERAQQAARGGFIDRRSLSEWAETHAAKASEGNLTLPEYEPAACIYRVETEAFAGAARVRLFALGEDDAAATLYVSGEPGSYRLVAASSPGRTDHAARMALSSLDAGSLERARAWLAFGRDDLEQSSDDDLAPLVRELLRATQEAGSEELRTLAYALEGGSPQSLQALQSAAGGRVSADRGRDLTLLAARAALRVAPERALELLARDTDWYPRERSVARLRIEALARTGQDAERADELARYADRYPADPWLRRTRLAFELERDFPAALEGIWQRHLQGKTTPAELEETVWMALFQDPSRPDWQRVTRLADAAAASSAGTNAWQNLLLAAAFTESGDLTQARKALRSAWAPQLQLRWVVLGRMAEKLGLREVAQQAFARVMPADDPRDPYTSAVLAQRALQRLRASPAK